MPRGEIFIIIRTYNYKSNSSNDDNTIIRRFQIDRVAFYGRTLPEYLKMFRFDDVISLKKYDTILDCPSGASSFVVEATRCGVNTVGCDPLFDKDAKTLSEQGEKDIEYVALCRPWSKEGYKRLVQFYWYYIESFLDSVERTMTEV